MKRILRKVLIEYKEMLNINDDVHIRLKRYKTKAASVNIRKNIITLNKEVLDLGEDVIRYLILHELTHLKLRSPYHDATFKELLEKNSCNLDIELARSKILNKLLRLKDINK